MNVHVIPVVISALVGICVIQAMYFPFLQSPEVETEWWQVAALAAIGYMVGLPVVILQEYLPDDYRELWWVLLAVWVLIIFLLTKWMVSRFAR